MELARVLAAYGEYHRDRRNVATHLVGIPMILAAVEILLSRPIFLFADAIITPAMAASALAWLFYLRLDLRFALAMGVIMALLAWAGLLLARHSTGLWAGAGAGLFVAGWIIQFVGHGFEGRKPAFLDDVKSLLVGPLFVVAELAFMLGLRKNVRDAMHGELAGLAGRQA